jgi:hypothetical protein
MPSTQERQIGAQFDILDKATAAHATNLYRKDRIAPQEYQEWLTDYYQVADFGNRYGGVAYVAKQWAAEAPRYVQIMDVLKSKIGVANPKNYDTRISISNSGQCCDGCSGTKIPTLPYTPVGNYGGGGGGSNPLRNAGNLFLSGDSNYSPSIGDAMRGANPLPFFEPPKKPIIDKTSFWTQILVAIIIGASLFGLHKLTKKS